MQHFVRNNIYT